MILTPKRIIGIFIFSKLFMSGCTTLPDAPRYVAPALEPEILSEMPIHEVSPKQAIGGIMEYNHEKDRQYTVYAGTGELTPIVLVPGDRPQHISIAASSGWRIDDRQNYGNGRSSTAVVLVSPEPGAKRTTAIVTTSAREGLYMLTLVPHPKGHRSVQFHRVPKHVQARASIPATGTWYSLRGDGAAWSPLAVYDDGRHTYVRLRSGIGGYGMPAVVATGTDGKTRPVNSRLVGDTIVVDGIHPALELKIGKESIEAVRS